MTAPVGAPAPKLCIGLVCSVAGCHVPPCPYAKEDAACDKPSGWARAADDIEQIIRKALDLPENKTGCSCGQCAAISMLAIDLAKREVRALDAARTEEDGPWKQAVIDAAVVNWTFTKEHETDPRAAINALLVQAQREALDPTISEAAKVLVDAARAEGASALLLVDNHGIHYWRKAAAYGQELLLAEIKLRQEAEARAARYREALRQVLTLRAQLIRRNTIGYEDHIDLHEIGRVADAALKEQA